MWFLLVIVFASVVIGLWCYSKRELAEFSPEMLHKGTYLACGGYVFDVSSSEAYKPPGEYSVFVGNECSSCLAKMSTDPALLNTELELTEQEEGVLREWVVYMKKKYPVVGTLNSAAKKTE